MIVNAEPSITKNRVKNNIQQSESYWKDLPLAKKVDDVVKPVIKFCFPAIVIGVILFVAIPIALSPTLLLSTLIHALLLPYEIILIAIAVITVTAVVGLIAITFFISLHFMKNAIVELKKLRQSTGKKIENPGLGKWSENSVAITKNCEETVELRLKLIEQAEKTIEISGNHCNGRVFDDMLSKIEEQLEKKPELKVRIISSSILLTKNNRKKIKNLAKKYPDRFYSLITKRQLLLLGSLRAIANHLKLFIVDGKIVITGGTGIADVLCRTKPSKDTSFLDKHFSHSASSDMDIVLEKGPIIGVIRKRFYNLLSKWKCRYKFFEEYGEKNCKYETISNTEKSNLNVENKFTRARAKMIYSGHEHGPINECKNTYLEMIKSAKNSIFIGNLCLNQNEILEELIKADKKDGMKIKIVTNINHSNAPPGAKVIGVMNLKSLSILKSLTKNVEIYGFNQKDIIYHKKVMVVDKKWVVIGSCNINNTSMGEKGDFGSRDENLVVVKSKDIAKEVENVLEEDLKNSISLEKIKTPRFLNNILFFHLVSWTEKLI